MPPSYSSPTKRSPRSPYAKGNPSNQRLAQRDGGRWILRQDAAKTYKLQLKDLDLIDPIEVQPNPHGRGEMRKYNERDVAALARRLHYAKASNTTMIAVSSTDGGSTVLTPAQILAVPSGPRILRTHALNDFDLTRAQLDTIRPISVEPNPHGPRSQSMRYYNLCDVEALHKRLLKVKARD
ncbi:hypothetical protein F5051DRAFT_421279 [Lentinula edodes]|nr:hypothetical protein F5051DRAFT_421279 [Lentinula edodes]